MVAHEYAHGYAALKQGDTTAYSLGRLTWNPIPHIDLFMTILLPLVTYFTTGIAFGGVATNFLIEIACIPLIIAVGALGRAVPVASETGSLIQTMLLYGILINLALAAFNLIPIPPLDGSHVFKYILPPAWALNYQRLGAQGLLILFLLISFGGPLLNFWFKPVLFLDRLASRAVFPYILPSQWTM